MAELRALIDALDAELVAQLALRARCIDRAAQIKQGVGLPARIPSRVEDVVAKVRARAEAEGLDADLAETLWRHLIEWSIAREERTLGPDEGRTGGPNGGADGGTDGDTP
ncbi:MAG: chorismate mutase [Alkalilacustris sp.]